MGNAVSVPGTTSSEVTTQPRTVEARTVFSEVDAEQRTAEVPLSHLSIELGHLYMDDFERGRDYMQAQFERVRPWADVARQQALPAGVPGARPRVSTCFLVDDYFNRFGTPAQVVPDLLAAAKDKGVTIDYLARESGCAEADGVKLAELVRGRLVADPPPATNGTRPPVAETGWLCNGQRSPAAESTEALRQLSHWQPPVENGARNHSIFMDVELWDGDRVSPRWSCAFLAGVWQLLRLGVLRYEGRSVVAPKEWPGAWPDDWDLLPPVVKVNKTADPFNAYQTVSILSSGFLPIEAAVRTILAQVRPNREAADQVLERSAGEKIALPPELVERVSYVFLTGDPKELLERVSYVFLTGDPPE
jgi:hypothetical protein